MTDLTTFRSRYPEHAIMLDGGLWRYFDTGGTGTPVIMLPGGQGTGEVFHHQAEELGVELRMIGLCYPGGEDARLVADGARSFMAVLGIDHAHLLGTSYGGYIAQIMAVRDPAAIGCLILSNSFVDAGPAVANWPSEDTLRSTPAIVIRDAAVGKLRANTDRRPGYREVNELLIDQLVERQTPESFKSRLVGVRSAGPLPALPIADERIVVIDCDDDPVLPPIVRAQLHDRHPTAERHSLNWGDHYPALLRPEEYTAIVASRLIYP